MRIRIVCNLGTSEFGEQALMAGEHEVPQAFGERLIARGLAVDVTPPPAPPPPPPPQAPPVSEKPTTRKTKS